MARHLCNRHCWFLVGWLSLMVWCNKRYAQTRSGARTHNVQTCAFVVRWCWSTRCYVSCNVNCQMRDNESTVDNGQWTWKPRALQRLCWRIAVGADCVARTTNDVTGARTLSINVVWRSGHNLTINIGSYRACKHRTAATPGHILHVFLNNIYCK